MYAYRGQVALVVRLHFCSVRRNNSLCLRLGLLHSINASCKKKASNNSKKQQCDSIENKNY